METEITVPLENILAKADTRTGNEKNEKKTVILLLWKMKQ